MKLWKFLKGSLEKIWKKVQNWEKNLRHHVGCFSFSNFLKLKGSLFSNLNRKAHNWDLWNLIYNKNWIDWKIFSKIEIIQKLWDIIERIENSETCFRVLKIKLKFLISQLKVYFEYIQFIIIFLYINFAFPQMISSLI